MDSGKRYLDTVGFPPDPIHKDSEYCRWLEAEFLLEVSRDSYGLDELRADYERLVKGG